MKAIEQYCQVVLFVFDKMTFKFFSSVVRSERVKCACYANFSAIFCCQMSPRKQTRMKMISMMVQLMMSLEKWIKLIKVKKFHIRWAQKRHLPVTVIRKTNWKGKIHYSVRKEPMFSPSAAWNSREIKGVTSRFLYLEKCSLNFSSSSFAIRLNLLHP